MSDYPAAERQSCMFAIQYLRWLFHSGAGNEIGPDAIAVLCAVVTLEDEFHYQRAVNFTNSQLMSRCGMRSEHALITARQRAVDAGLLFYKSGAKRRPGRYFVVGFTAENAAKVKRKSSECETKASPSIPKPKPKPIDAAHDLAFQEFWEAYPLRKGRKVGKQDAAKAFAKIKLTEHTDLMRAVGNYSSQELPKDACRFLAKDYWRDWLTVATAAAAQNESDMIPKANRRAIS